MNFSGSSELYSFPKQRRSLSPMLCHIYLRKADIIAVARTLTQNVSPSMESSEVKKVANAYAQYLPAPWRRIGNEFMRHDGDSRLAQALSRSKP